MEHIIPVSVHRKVARNESRRTYVCGNSDYEVEFTFDNEWDGLDTKTARFISNGKYVDVVFEGNRCKMPVMSNTNTVTVGVYAGNLKTTTPAVILATKSILCGGGLPADPTPDVYAQIMEMLNAGAGGGEVTDEQIAQAVEAYMSEHPVQVEETDPTVPDWARQPEKPTYTAEEVGAQPKGDYALRSEIPAIPVVPVQSVNGKTGEVVLTASDVGALPADTTIPAPYDLPTASATVKGGVRVGEGLQMTGDVLGVVPEGEFGDKPLVTIVVAENVQKILINVDEEGRPLNLQEAMVCMYKSPTDEINLHAQVQMGNAENPAYIYVYQRVTASSASKHSRSTSWARQAAGMWRAYKWESAGDIKNTNGSNVGALNMTSPSARNELKTSVVKAITTITIMGYTGGYIDIPAGTTIEIWGVRADA